MRIAVLSSPDSWYFQDLLRAARQEHELVPVGFRQLSAQVANTRGGARPATLFAGELDLSSFDALLVRSMPPGSLEQVVFRMNALAELAAGGLPVINPPRAIEIAVDKYLATSLLAAAGLTVPPTIACQSVEQALTAFESLGGDVVVKPLFGSEGRGITRLTDPAIALRTFKVLEQIGAVLYLQKFIPHEGCDLRLLTLGEQVLGMRRRHPTDWRTNVSRGAVGEPLDVTDELAELALRAAAAVQAPVAGVDLIEGQDGKIYALEVNAVPGWRELARVTGVDVAEQILDYLRQERHS